MRRPSLVSRLLVALVVVLLAGCMPAAPLATLPPASSAAVSPDGLTLTADRSTYARGATAGLTLRNGSSAAVTTGVLECAQIEVWSGGTWAPSPTGNDRACIMIARTLRPGETMTGGVALDVPPGTYRLSQSASVEGRDVGVRAATAAFRVGA